MGQSFYRGEQSRYLNKSLPSLPGNNQQIFTGHVLNVLYEYTTPGAIEVKLISIDRKSDDTISRIALPADRNIIKYPLPGELVFLLNGMGSSTIKDRFATQLYYITNISSNSSVVFNSNPYYSSIETTKTVDEVFTKDYEVRFEKKIQNYESYKNIFGDKQVRERPNLKPLEGDFILQSRFGSTVRIGSTGNEKTGLTFSNRIGPPGDPLLLLSVPVKTDNTASRLENVNTDAASIFLCSTQTIPIVLGCSSQLKTHRIANNLK